MADQDQEPGHVRPTHRGVNQGLRPQPVTRIGAAPRCFAVPPTFSQAPEAAERAFAITTGKIKPADGERADLTYSRFLPPNAEILEDQIVPLEAGRPPRGGLQNSGMAAIMNRVSSPTPAPTPPSSTPRPLYGGTTGLIHTFLEPFGVRGIPVRAGRYRGHRRRHPRRAQLLHRLLETPAKSTMTMTRSGARFRRPRPLIRPPRRDGRQHLPRTHFSAPHAVGRPISCLYSATKYLSGFSDMLGGSGPHQEPGE